MEELTSVVRSAEVKQRQRTEAGSDVWRGGELSREGLLQPERHEDKVGFGGARGLRSGRQRGHEVAGGCAAVTCTRSGPRQSFYLIRFSNTHILIFEKVIFLMSKFHQIFHRDSWNYKEQPSFLTQLQIPKGCKLQILESIRI
jgi:hypothetical protein